MTALSPVIGGPLGDHAGSHRWWNPLRVLLAVTTVTLGLGLVQQVPCERNAWSTEKAQYAQLCASGIAESYVEEGLSEGTWPLSSDAGVRDRFGASDLPALTAAWAWSAARLTHMLAGPADRGARSQRPLDELAGRDDVRREVRVFVAVNAVGLAVLALLTTVLLTRAARGYGRSWDAAVWAASPLLALLWLAGWTVLPAALAAAALAAWSTRRRAWARGCGVAAVAALVPWHDPWDPELGGIWLAIEQAAGRPVPTVWIVGVGATVLVVWSGVVSWLMRGRAGDQTRAAQVVCLVSVGVLVVSPQAPPTWSLLLLPALALAAPQWRDVLAWQVGELIALLLTGLYLGGYLAPAGGGPAVAYWVAIAVRIAAQTWLAVAVCRPQPMVGQRTPVTLL